MASKENILVTAMSVKMFAEIVTYGNGYYKGKLHSQFLDEPFEFFTLIKMLEKMENIFDEKKFPQAFLSRRTFSDSKKNSPTNALDSEQKPAVELVQPADDACSDGASTDEVEITGKCTFEILVRFRQNASWQGQIFWVEKKQKQDFQSELEMFKLMDEALLKTDPTSKQVAWN